MKTILVTGANRGIGRAICKGLLTKGHRIILTSRSLINAEKAKQDLNVNGDQLHILELDATDDRSINSAAKQISTLFPCIDVLINNAGIYPDGKNKANILNIERDLLVDTFNTNTFGPIKVVQAFLPLLEKSSDARIVNLSSGYGQLDGLSADVPSYCLSKLTLNGVTIMLHQALQKKKISVFSMCPGWVHTDMGGSNAPRTPEEGADTAIWLATEASPKQSGKMFRDRQVIPW